MARLTSNKLKKIIDEFDASIYENNRSYFEGDNVSILSKDFEGTPDNRIPLPFARRTIKDIMGYAYKPGNVTYQFAEKTDEKTIEELKRIFKFNEEPLVSGEIYEDALVNGEGCELMYFADDIVQFVQVPREQCIFSYFDEIKPKLEFSIRTYSIVEYDDQGQKQRINKADVYWSDIVEYYEARPEYTFADDPQKEQKQSAQGLNDYLYVSEEPHPFKEPPLYPYRVASDKLGVFQPYKKIIDILDDIGSDKVANALQKFADDFLAMSKELDPEFAEKINEYRIFDKLGTKQDGNFVEFIKREIDIASSVQGFELYERLYYDLIGVPNLNDEKFEGKSGIAMMFALVPFENLVSGYEIYFSQGLQHRLKLINNAIGALDFDPGEATIKWERNLPADIDRTVENVVNLKASGLFSDETLLKFFPADIVEDALEEIGKREKEKEQRIETALNAERIFTEEEQEE